jgi:hypothetical protein
LAAGTINVRLAAVRRLAYEAADTGLEKNVTVEKVLTGRDTTTNRPIVSYDEGKTWAWNDDGTPVLPSKTVYVMWKKVDD